MTRLTPINTPTINQLTATVVLIGIPTGLGTVVVGLATTVITIGGANLLFDGSVNTAVSQFGDVADDDLTWPRITV